MNLTIAAHAAAQAYGYPLLIKQLLHTTLTQASQQEIVYADRFRYTYADFNRRIQRLANTLAGLGVAMGDTVAVMDWDSHRYLESYFAVPMMISMLVQALYNVVDSIFVAQIGEKALTAVSLAFPSGHSGRC